jgi:hypothetical protein
MFYWHSILDLIKYFKIGYEGLNKYRTQIKSHIVRIIMQVSEK